MAGEDPKHLERLRAMPCALCDAPGPSDAHHATFNRGLSQRGHDHEAFPLCHRHHMDFHNASGAFKEMTHEERDQWQRSNVAVYCPKNDPDVF